MGSSYKVLWTLSAEHDLEGVIDYIQHSHPVTALKILKTVRSKASTLKRNPMRGRRLPELAHLPDLSFRELIITPWRLIYRTQKGIVQVLAFIDGRRDLEEILFEKLSRVS